VLELDLVDVPGGTLAAGQEFETVKAVWHDHADLDLPWHYFAKQTGSLNVEVPALRVLRTPVTWSQLAAVDAPLAERLRPESAGLDHPANDLSWAEATEAARRLGDLVGLDLRIPTEWEWEHFARGGGNRRYPWGEEFDVACANLAEAGVGRTEPVGSRPDGASAAGLLDLAGNVDEWTASVYEPLPGAHWTVPHHETWSVDPHGTRGGSFDHHRDLALTRRRHAVYRPWQGAGFRVVTAG
jgi:formylglycine-generating enzyme required for sulfatase activity